MVETILEVVAYAALGTLVMSLVSWIFDLIVPYDFQGDLAQGNKAAGWVCAGTFIGTGFLLRTIIADAPANTISTLFDGMVETLIWGGIALVLVVAAYFLVDWLLFRKINFNEEIKSGNEAVGIVVFGLIVGLCFIISGAVL